MPTLSPPRPAPAGLPGTHGGRDRVSRTSGGGLRSRAGRLWPRGSHSRFIPCAGSASRGRCPWFQPLPPRLLPRPRSPDLGTGHGLGTRGRGGRGLRGSVVSGFQPTAQRRTSHRGTPTTEKNTIFLTVKARFTLDWSQTWTGRELPGDPAAARLWIREVWGRDGGAGCLTSSRRRRHCWPGGPLRASRI